MRTKPVKKEDLTFYLITLIEKGMLKSFRASELVDKSPHFARGYLLGYLEAGLDVLEDEFQNKKKE